MSLGLVAEQRFNFGADSVVARAVLVQEGRALVSLALQSSVVDSLDFFPAIRLHPNSLLFNSLVGQLP